MVSPAKIVALLAGFLLLNPCNARAERLNEIALYHRCYAHLTQRRLPRTDARLVAVQAGTKTAAQACAEILDLARFSANNGTEIANRDDLIARSVLASMHQLHRSWARDYGIFDISGNSRTVLGTETWNDESPLGAYITRALFAPDLDVASVVTGATFLQARRLNMNPTRLYRGVPNSTANAERDFRFGASHPFAPRGALIGIEPVSVPPIVWTRLGGDTGMPDFPNLTPEASQAVSDINFTDVNVLKGPLSESTQFGVWVQGQLQITTPGSYTFYLDIAGSNDQVDFYIDGVRLIQGSSTAVERSASRTLAAGLRPVQLRYRQFSGGVRAILSWMPPGAAREVIPSGSYQSLQAGYYLHGAPQTVNITGHEGGGFIGNHNYLLTTFREASGNFVPNGQLATNRSWPRAVLKDALCREVPVVREADVTQFVVSDSAIPFRQNAACTACHASLDRQAGIIRGLRYNVFNSFDQDSPAPDMHGFLGLRFVAPTAALRTDWSDQTDSSYAVRPAYGHFYFRNYRGELVDTVIRSIEELGAAIRAQDDYYACFAKRYYQYFLGIDADLGDPGDTTYRAPNAVDSYHRQRVIDLGLQLKQHRSLRQLVLDIIGTEEYRMSDSGIHYSGAQP